MTSASIDSSLQDLSLFFDVVVVVRLVYLQFFRRYPFFFLMLCVPLVLQTAAVRYGESSNKFLRYYWYWEPVRNVLFILVVWELFSVIFRNYAGLRSLSRWVMGIAAVIALVAFVLTALPSGVVLFNHSQRATRIIRVERGVALALVIFILVMLYFISRYPIKLPRNNVVLCMLYSIWFLGDCAILLVSSYQPGSPEHLNIENICVAALEIGSYIGWTLLLTKTGEYQETRVRQHLSPEREQSLIVELNAMNDLLVRAGRSISHSH